jgi:tight adherence protein C
MSLILIVAVTFAIVTGLVLAGHQAATTESPITQRLRAMVPALEAAPPAGADGLRIPALVERALATLGRFAIGGSEASLGRTLTVAGIRGGNPVLLFLGIRTLVSVGPALLILVPQVSSGRPLGRSLVMGALAWAAGHVLVTAWLKRRARRRTRRIMTALPDVLDLMIVCLESGLGLNAAIARVGEERAKLGDPLGLEFEQASLELRGGRSREEALRALADRNGVDDIRALVALIIQSDRLGASMGKTLRVHADILRTKRRQRAEEAARKLPIKILFPLALFVLPALMIVVAGPALLKIGDLVKVMGGQIQKGRSVRGRL